MGTKSKSSASTFLLLFVSFITPTVFAYKAGEVATSQNSTQIVSTPTIGPFSVIVALPLAPASGGASGVSKLSQSPVPLQLNFLKAFVLTARDQEVTEKISRFVQGTKEVCPKNKSYRGQASSGKLLLSLCILAYVLEFGPTSEHQALEIPIEESSNISNPKEKITVSLALAQAIADWNSLSKQIYVEQPELLEKPTPFLKFVRENLLYLKNAEKKFCSSGSC
jgi:hypothetical protein